MAVTAEGEPTTDPAVATIPLPVGGAKGSGMSLVFELLTSGLAGNPIVTEFHSDALDGRRHRQNATLIAVDVAAFLPVDEYRAITDQTIETVKALPPAVDGEPVLYPGERGAGTYEERLRDGVPLAPKVWDELAAAATALGVGLPAVGAGAA